MCWILWGDSNNKKRFYRNIQYLNTIFKIIIKIRHKILDLLKDKNLNVFSWLDDSNLLKTNKSVVR